MPVNHALLRLSAGNVCEVVVFPLHWGLLITVLACSVSAAAAQDRAAETALPERAHVVRPAMPGPPGLYPSASEARLGGDASRTRLVVDLSRPVEVAAFTLADPYRVVIDLPQITFQLPARTGTSPKGLVKAF